MLAVIILYNELMNKDEFIKFGNGYIALNFPDFGKALSPHISSSAYGFKKGIRDANNYSEDEFIEMLNSREYEDVYKAFGAIGRRKLKKTLPYLKTIALYDEDKAVQKEAIRTIRRIGGKKAFEILRFLRTTEYRDFAQKMLNLKHIDNIDAY